MRIVVFGGTFDPWTSCHQEITERLSVEYDYVIVVPTTVKYYKINTQMFSFNERFEAAKRKVSGLKNVEVYDTERFVDENWRFVHTLQKIIALNGTKHEYFIAIGSDSLQKFTTWYEWETILKLSKLVVFNRPGYTTDFPDIPYIYEQMDNPISSTKIRAQITKLLNDQDFEDMLDEDWVLKGQKIIAED